MQILTLDAATQTKKEAQITTDVHILHFRGTFRAEAVAFDYNRMETLMTRFREACTGKVSLFYNDSGNSTNTPLINNRPLADVLELHGALDTGIDIRFSSAVGGGSAHHIFKFDAKVVVSLPGTVKLGVDNFITLELNDFTNAPLAGVAATNCDLTISVFSDVSATYSKELLKLSDNYIAAGQDTDFDLAGKSMLAIPSNVDTLMLFGYGNTQLRIGSADFRTYVVNTTRDHILVDGLIMPFHKWGVVPVPNHSKGTISVTGGSGRIYFFETETIK